MSNASDATAALAGVRILDCTQGIAGPMAAMFFADFGADVIKVNPPGGDRLASDPGYLCWNRNKTLTALDPGSAGDLAELRRLIAAADAVIFDSLPGELEQLGLDAGTLAARHPGLVHAWMPPHGTTGRWSQLPPDELLLSAVSGVADMQYTDLGVPVAMVTPQLSYAHGMLGAAGIAAALLERKQTGHASHVVVSGLHAVAAVEGTGAVRAPGITRDRFSPVGSFPHCRLYECGDDEWLFFCALTPAFFFSALEALDLLEIMALPEVGGEFANVVNLAVRPIVARLLEERFRERPRQYWLDLLHEADVPSAPVGDRAGWFHGETVAANGMFVEINHEELGTVQLPGVPVRLSRTPGSVRHLPAQPATVAASKCWRQAPPAAPGAFAVRPPGRPLEGVRILDLGAFIAGTFGPTILANYGAEVIKVEPLDGDPYRTYALNFLAFNQGKRSIALNLKRPEGRAAFLELVRAADVVVDGFRAGARQRLGIDYEGLCKVNPRIITCSVTAYGAVGPLRDEPGFDPLLQARGGIMKAQGGDGPPVFHQMSLHDTATGLVSAFGILAALHARELTGQGQEVQTSLASLSILCQSGELTTYPGRPAPARGGVEHPGDSAFHRFYPCHDGWIALAATTRGHVESTLHLSNLSAPATPGGIDDLLQEPPLGTWASALGSALSGIPRGEALDRLAGRGVPAAPVLHFDDLFDDPWLIEHDFFHQVESAVTGDTTTVNTFASFDGQPAAFALPAPRLGEHSEESLVQAGIEVARIRDLIDQGVVSAAPPVAVLATGS